MPSSLEDTLAVQAEVTGVLLHVVNATADWPTPEIRGLARLFESPRALAYTLPDGSGTGLRESCSPSESFSTAMRLVLILEKEPRRSTQLRSTLFMLIYLYGGASTRPWTFPGCGCCHLC